MIRAAALAGLLACLAACGGGDGDPPLTASGARIFAPLPGQDAVVAYMTLHNESVSPVVVAGVTSREFATVQMHATVLGDGIAEMIPLDAITIAEESEVDFTVGGRHLMLTDPVQSLAPGDEVTLEFHYGGDRSLVVQAPLQPREPGDG